MDWLKLIDSVLICTTLLLIVGVAAATLLICYLYDKATDSPENFAKVLATVKEQTRWFQPRPLDQAKKASQCYEHWLAMWQPSLAYLFTPQEVFINGRENS